MIDNFRKRYDIIMNGGISYFTEHEVFDFITHLDYFHINTLQVQSCPTKSNGIIQWFICKVDEPTIKAYLKEKRNEARIV